MLLITYNDRHTNTHTHTPKTQIGGTLGDGSAFHRDLYLTQYKTVARERHPCFRRESIPQSQEASSPKTTTQTVQVSLDVFTHCVQQFKAYWSRDAPTSSTFNNCTLCPHFIYVFCIYLTTNSDLCHLQHKLNGFYNRDEKCLQRGTDWVFK